MYRQVKLRRRTVGEIRRVLAALARARQAPADVRANAGHWAQAVRRQMNRRDVQTVAWLLLGASGERAIPFDLRAAARVAASGLEAHYL